jgi:hypothetical protein
MLRETGEGFRRFHQKRFPALGSPAYGLLSFLPSPQARWISRKDFYDIDEWMVYNVAANSSLLLGQEPNPTTNGKGS